MQNPFDWMEEGHQKRKHNQRLVFVRFWLQTTTYNGVFAQSPFYQCPLACLIATHSRMSRPLSSLSSGTVTMWLIYGNFSVAQHEAEDHGYMEFDLCTM